ncbi:toll/interleukin-1 receptor domain-containing protein [Amycolatopsis kentuckyensis]|uniref:toll/interleukin-1 receptor domain-containing protein n=1 Tax=Amycolatopsis kentuckyensis TaxID=218823 RepID=UPI001302C78F|nr:toll/interleukin-1 receptor domain-containing protein [Amycolatopsis kentuckyensis]
MAATSSTELRKIFISYSGSEYYRMERLCARLKARKVPFFIDRQGNHLGDSVTAKIEEELNESAFCLVYYSKRYAKRHACQSELMRVLVAEAREGVPRTLVVNPEDDKAHIHPAALRDRLYVPGNESDAALDHLVDELVRRSSQVSGTFRGIDFRSLPRIAGRRPGVETRVRRYGSMWQLHSALHASRYGLTHPPTNGIAVLTGLSGAGKTALADDYRLHFAHEYGLVVEVDLGDATGTTAETALREAAARAESAVESAEGQALIIVDNIPAGVPRAFFTTGFERPEVLTLLVTEHGEYAGLGQEVRLGGLTDDEARELFHHLHRFDRDDEAESDTVGRLLAAVDNHPTAIALVAGSATTRRGLTALREHIGRVLDGTSDILTKLADLFDEHVRTANDYELAVLSLMAACGSAAVPVRLIRDVFTTLGLDRARVPAVLEGLESQRLVRGERGLWTMPGLLRPAVRRHPRAGLDHLAPICAEYLAGVLGAGPETHRDGEWAALVEHARHLVEQPGIPPAVVTALLPLIARELRAEGRIASAARYLDRLFASGAADPALAVDAASDHYEVGEYREVVETPARLARPVSAREGVLLECWRAAALDALGRFADAEPHWRRALDKAEAETLTEVERLQVRLLWLRGQRLRGIVKATIAELEKVLTAEGRLPARIAHLARIELAHAQMATGNQRRARELARHVRDAYAPGGRQHHPVAVDAAYVLATAELRLHFTELHPSEARWRAAEESLRRIARQREEELGPRNVEVLATRVSVDFAIISQGRPREVLENAVELFPMLQDRLGELHPIVLREHYIRGLAYSQLARFDEAIDELGRAEGGQVVALGIAHPETLQTQFELAMALKLRGHQGDMRRGNTLLDAVLERTPSVIGIRHDLPWQAFIAAKGARWAPARLLRMAHRQNHRHKW